MSAQDAPGLHPVLRDRVSAVTFDPEDRLTEREVAALLEAARWAPSAGNSQPWRFHLARRGTPDHGRVLNHLAPSAQRWAPQASMLVVNLAHREVAPGMPYSEFADFDLGQAVAHMTVQATAMGLSARQFRAFDLEALSSALRVPDGWAVVSATAIGRALRRAGLRDRLPVPALLHHPHRRHDTATAHRAAPPTRRTA